MRVERARSADVPALLALRRACEAWLAARGIPQWLPGEMPDGAVAAQVECGEWYVARAADRGLVGAMRVLDADPDYWGEDPTPAAYVHGLMVDRDRSGRGIGAALLDAAAGIGHERGAGVLRLDCAAANGPLRGYYRSLGFREERPHVVPGPEWDVILFERPISSP